MDKQKSYLISYISIFIAIVILLFGVGMMIGKVVNSYTPTDLHDSGVKRAAGSVLYIDSYDPNVSDTKLKLSGLYDVFDSNGVDMNVAFMDMMEFPTEQNYKHFYDKIKYDMDTNGSYDVIIASDDAALDFAEEFQSELFAQTPILFFNVNDINRAESARKNEWITGFVQKLFLEETIEAALEQFPASKSIVGMFDDSVSGVGNQNQFYRMFYNHPELNFFSLNINDYTPQELAERIGRYSSDSLIVSIVSMSNFRGYSKKYGYTTSEFAQFLEEHCSAHPIFSTGISGIGSGFVGGKIKNSYGEAQRIANYAVDILNGDAFSDLPIDSNVPGSYFFDYNIIKKYDLSLKKLPDDAVLLNEPESPLDKYADMILPFSLIVFSLLMFLGVMAFAYTSVKKVSDVMIVMNRKMHQANRDLLNSKRKLTYIANNDTLTDLPSRNAAEIEIKNMLGKNTKITLLLTDIDDFKNYNDTYTHACGDFILSEYGKRIRDFVKTGLYYAARYGGDEFLVVYKGGHLDENSPEIREFYAKLTEPIIFNSNKLDVTATIGIAQSAENLEFDEFVSNADLAMYEAKKQGRGTITKFNPQMKAIMQRKNHIISVLKEECSIGGFEIRYQPQVSVRTGEIYGFEALVRLQNYQFSPGEFIPVAESGGFISQIGRIVTEKVIAQMAQWRLAGMDLKKVAINYSNGQIVDDEYVPFLAKLLEYYNIPPSLVEIEITESLFIGNDDRAKALFDSLTKIGVGLALDDFGTGYSSLSYLTYLPVQKVKIDKSIVDNYLVDGRESFITNIFRLVHGLGMTLTVEGVEQRWQYDKLKAMNCDLIQGYFFSKPMHPDSVPDFSVDI